VVAGLDQETLRPTLIVTAVIFGIWLVTPFLGAIAPTSAPQPNGGGGNQGGQYITVGNVKFGLVQGWQLVNGPGAGRVTNGVADLDMYVYNFTGQPVDLYNQYNATQGQNSTGFNATAATPVGTNGLAGVRGSYSGSFQGTGTLDGEVTVVTTGGKGYVFDVYAPAGLLNQYLPQAEEMLATLQPNQ